MLFIFQIRETEKKKEINHIQEIIEWFSAGNEIDLLNDLSQKEYIPAKFHSRIGRNCEEISPKSQRRGKLFLHGILLHGLVEILSLVRIILLVGIEI